MERVFKQLVVDDIKTTLGENIEYCFPFATETLKGKDPYGCALCLSVNDEIVHARPNDKPLKNNDILTIDGGICIDGYCSDMATTVCLGDFGTEANRSSRVNTLLQSTKDAIKHALQQCKPGNTLRNVSHAIQEEATRSGCGLIKQFGGHGIGRTLHELPYIGNAQGLTTWDVLVLRPGMSLCIEPMLTLGDSKIVFGPDGWTILTADGSLACHEERHIIITEDGYEVLTERN